MHSLIVGLGRSGGGLHLPVLHRVRASHCGLITIPAVVFDPRGGRETPSGAVRASSLTHAASLADPHRTVVHVCTPPDVRVEVLTELAELGFRRVLVEKPLVTDRSGLEEITRLRRRWPLDVAVVAPLRASALTSRIDRIVRTQRLGALRSISMVQRKPRFTRSLAGDRHRSVFDVEIPHAVGVAMALAGRGEVLDADCTDMCVEGMVLPQMGSGRLSLEHAGGVSTQAFSDLTAPRRERRITVELERATLVGHYACSEEDHTAQLRVVADGCDEHAVFDDDALTTFMARAYQRFATTEPGDQEPVLDGWVVDALDDAKRLCGWAGGRVEPARSSASAPRCLPSVPSDPGVPHPACAQREDATGSAEAL